MPEVSIIIPAYNKEKIENFKQSGGEKIKVSVCIPVYNEEKNIAYLLDSVINQELKSISIEDITVVSSGSTDKTETIVKSYQAKDSRIALIRQDKREGKASAINTFLKNTHDGIVIVSSGDIIFERRTVEDLCNQFLNSDIGLTSVNPIPIGSNSNFAGFLGYMHWKLHNAFKRHGEAIAFRRYLVSELAVDTAVDEGWVEAAICNKGYKTVHVDSAVVYNKCPDTVGDFLKRRRSIYAGHLDLKNRTGYTVSSSRLSIGAIKIIMKELFSHASEFHYFLVYLFLEMYGRLLGMFDFYIKKKNLYIWETAETTKKVK